MPNYEDRRGRYSNIAPWLVGQIKDQLPVIREQAGRRFRHVTNEIPPEPVSPIADNPESQQSLTLQVQIPSEKDIEL